MPFLDNDTLFPGCKVTLLDAPVDVDEPTMSFDPGRTTGIAIALPGFPKWIAAEVQDYVIIWRVLHAYKPAVILFERFHAENPAANDEALDVRGVVKLYRASTIKPRVPPQIWWNPREAKKNDGGHASNAALKALGVWIPGLGHDRDAIRHMIWHLINRCDRMELLQWAKPAVS